MITTSAYYYMYDPTEFEKKEVKEEIELPVVPGWRDSDYQDCRDMMKRMADVEPFDYAQCVWLLNQRDKNVKFGGLETWDRWYDYAVKTCLRFAKEQGRWTR